MASLIRALMVPGQITIIILIIIIVIIVIIMIIIIFMIIIKIILIIILITGIEKFLLFKENKATKLSSLLLDVLFQYENNIEISTWVHVIKH